MTLLPMENRESILCALKCFGQDKPSNIPPILEDYIKQVASNGQTMLPWIYIKPLVLHKFNKVVDNLIAEFVTSDCLQLSQSVTELRQRVYNSLRSLEGIPFTIQRICELLENPFRHYNRPDKFLRGFEKVCLVVSRVDPQGNKLLHEDPRFPSRAGLEGSDGLSPPPSPPVEDLHKQQMFKSSDDDEITEDDDNEDDDNPLESSSSTSPDSTLMNRPILSSDTSVPASWPFGSVRSNDVSSSKVFPVDSTSCSSEEKVEDSVIDNFLSPTSLRSDDQNSSVNVVGQEISENRSHGVYLTDSHAESKVTDVSDLVSPVQILRPIGQLEAFVQNMGADMPSLSSCLLNPVMGEPVLVGHGTSEKSEQQVARGSTDIAFDPRPVAIRRGKRCSVSPDLSDTESDSLDSPETIQDPAQLDYTQSPAKRRRLSESCPDTLGLDNQPVLSDSPSASLNGSPPIIVCHPDGHNRDRESDEQTANPSLPVGHVGNDSEATVAPEASYPCESENPQCKTEEDELKENVGEDAGDSNRMQI